MKVLVTGASGFIGRRAVAQLLANSIEVVAVSRTPLPERPGLTPLAIDLLAPGAAERAVERAGATHLLHFAWNATPGAFWTAPDNLDWAATTLVLTRAFAASGGVRAVYAGTCAEYGWDRATLAESDLPAPATFYGRIKDATRTAVCAAGAQFGLSVAWGRIFWLYGPREHSGRLVSDVARALIEGRVAECSEGAQARDFLHVDDVAGAFVAALSSDWRGPFNVGSGKGVPVRDIVSLLADEIGSPGLLRLGARPSPPDDPPMLQADITILRERIGFTPRFMLGAGLRDTAAWWRGSRD